MTRIIPTRTAVKPAEAPWTATRRPMVRRAATATQTAAPAAKTKNPGTALSAVLRSAAKLDAEIQEVGQALASLNARRDGLLADAARLLHDAGMTEYTDPKLAYVAEIIDKMSKSSIDISPQKLQEVLKKMRKADEFWNVIKVGVVELRKVMTEAEIAKIGVTTPAKVIGSEVVIRSLTEKKKKRSK